MAAVSRNPDDTYQVTLSPVDFRVLKRWAQEASLPVASRVAVILNEAIQIRQVAYRQKDGATMAAKYASCTAEQQAAVDTILKDIIPEP